MKNISSRAKNALFFCIVAGLSTTASAKSGDIDTSFGTDGTASFLLSDTVYDLFPEPIAVDRFNRLVIGTNFVGGAQIEVLMPNGDIDTGFGSGGSTLVNLAVREIAVDSLNRIVVLQTDTAAIPQLTRISRFLPDGATDMSFGSSGSVELTSLMDDVVAGGIAVDGSDNIYVGGTVFDTMTGGVAHIYAAKVTFAGMLDSSFAGGGFNVLHLDTSATEDSSAWGIALDSSNQIVLTGVSVDTAAGLGLQDVVRLTATGDLDTTFGHGTGFVRTDALAAETAPHTSVGRSITTDASGNILVAATATSFGTFQSVMALSRYTPAGEFDTTFAGGSPALLSDPDDLTEARSVKIDGRGNILLSGMMMDPSADLVPTIFRRDSNGDVDTTFASHGMLQLSTAEPGSGGSIALAHGDYIVTATASETSTNAWVTRVLDHDPIRIGYPSGF